MLPPEKSLENPQCNMAPHPFLDSPLPILSYNHFSSKVFRPTHFHQFWNVDSFMKGLGG